MTEPVAELPTLMAEGHAMRAAGDIGAAVAMFRRASEAFPLDPWPRHALAETLLQDGAVEAASSVYAELRAGDPNDLHGLMGEGLCLRRRARPAAALPWFQRAVAAHPGEAWAYLALAETLLEAGQPSEAASTYTRLLARMPGQLQAMVGLGLARAAAGDLHEAADALRLAVQAHPADAWPRLALAEALLRLGLAEEAEESCRAVLQNDATHLHALVNLAACRRCLGDAAGGQAALLQAIDAHPHDPWPRLVAAEVMADSGQFGEAAALLTGLLDGRPTCLDAWEMLGRIQRRAGRLAEALEAFGRAASLDKARTLPWLERAGILRQTGRVQEADAALRQVLSIDPMQDAALLARSELSELRGDLDAALELARAAAALAPGRAENLVAVSRCLSILGRNAEAEAAVEGAGALPAVAIWRAELAGRTGDWARGAALLTEALAAHPRDPALPAARDRAARRAGLPASLVPPPHVPPAERSRFLTLQGDEAGLFLEPALAAYRAARSVDPMNAEAAEGEARVALLSLDITGTRRALAALTSLRAAERAAIGLAPRASQTQVGQLLDEFTADAACLAALQGAQSLPAMLRAARLRALVDDYPDLTAPAALLLVAMRQAGCFRHQARPGMGIPRIVAQYWQDATLPPDLTALSVSWQAPGWRHVRLDLVSAQAFLARHHSATVQRAFRMAGSPEQRADLLRLAWLEVEGGLWADIDDRCLCGPEALAEGAGLLLWQEIYGTLGNNLIGAPPGHPLVSLALALAAQAILRGDAEMVWLSTGPGLLTRAFANWLPADPADWTPVLEGLRVPDTQELAGRVAVHCPAAYKLRGHWSRTGFKSSAGNGAESTAWS